MTLDELTALLTEGFEQAEEPEDVPYNFEDMLSAIAKWMHIHDPGFAKSDLIHMGVECTVLIQMLTFTRAAVRRMAAEAHDVEE